MRANTAPRGDLALIDPFSCCMWEGHDRLPDLLNEEACREVINSMARDGQRHPVLARQAKRMTGVQYELIYGARRLFAARQLNMKLLACVREIDDAQAFVEMDIENRLRRDISPYERGMAFKAWLRAGYFRSQDEIAKTLGLSKTRISRLMKFSELPAALITAFSDARQIKESWAVTLAARCTHPDTRRHMLAVARLLREASMPLDPKQVYKRMIDTNRRTAVERLAARDEIIRSTAGTPLFRLSYRYNDVHVILPRDIVPACVAAEIAEAVKAVLAKQRHAPKPGLQASERGPEVFDGVTPRRATARSDPRKQREILFARQRGWDVPS